ncbi:RNA helicase [Actinocatenispora thailandica]|uniref:RNA helicase n=1 Tax=Actinocatenispora thailandica TaxID=227318 RepID=A0A7R7DLS7_9ACTN|nr:DEAD/DEAH box helicase [Actinocatenispora thailandica]BCJ34064.1 RNA helicase [Actinocatenispora thailandica]
MSSSFSDFGLPARLAEVLTSRNLHTPTPIQAAAIPDALAGRDVLGRARTGSGKTLAFLLPLVARLTGGGRPKPGTPRALILAPTRELVGQIDEALQPLAAAARLTSRTVFGGVGQGPQVAALRRGVDVVVACPGRLEDLMRQGHCSLSAVQITVLDEADHMAALGFLPVVRRLLGHTPAGGQRMLFSATLDRDVDTLVRAYLSKPARHEADSAQSPVATMTHHVLQVEREHRLPVLVDLTSAPGRSVVFTRTKHGAKALVRQLQRNGVPAAELHGNLSQNARTRNLDDFRSGRVAALVATDIAARGIHVDDVALVVHADPPADHKAYLHRSGRTARAGGSGTVVTLASSEQAREVRQLLRAARINAPTTRVTSPDHPVLASIAPGSRELADPAMLQQDTRTAAPAGGSDAPTSTQPGGRGRRRGGRGRSRAAAHQPVASGAGQDDRRRRTSGTGHGGSARQPAAGQGGRRGRASGAGTGHSAAAFSARRH